MRILAAARSGFWDRTRWMIESYDTTRPGSAYSNGDASANRRAGKEFLDNIGSGSGIGKPQHSSPGMGGLSDELHPSLTRLRMCRASKRPRNADVGTIKSTVACPDRGRGHQAHASVVLHDRGRQRREGSICTSLPPRRSIASCERKNRDGGGVYRRGGIRHRRGRGACGHTDRASDHWPPLGSLQPPTANKIHPQEPDGQTNPSGSPSSGGSRKSCAWIERRGSIRLLGTCRKRFIPAKSIMGRGGSPLVTEKYPFSHPPAPVSRIGRGRRGCRGRKRRNPFILAELKRFPPRGSRFFGPIPGRSRRPALPFWRQAGLLGALPLVRRQLLSPGKGIAAGVKMCPGLAVPRDGLLSRLPARIPGVPVWLALPPAVSSLLPRTEARSPMQRLDRETNETVEDFPPSRCARVRIGFGPNPNETTVKARGV